MMEHESVKLVHESVPEYGMVVLSLVVQSVYWWCATENRTSISNDSHNTTYLLQLHIRTAAGHLRRHPSRGAELLRVTVCGSSFAWLLTVRITTSMGETISVRSGSALCATARAAAPAVARAARWLTILLASASFAGKLTGASTLLISSHSPNVRPFGEV